MHQPFIRQWGYCTTETTPYMTQKLNINYTKENYFVIGCDGGGSRNLYSFPNRTLSKFNIANTAMDQMVLWFSIGCLIIYLWLYNKTMFYFHTKYSYRL